MGGIMEYCLVLWHLNHSPAGGIELSAREIRQGMHYDTQATAAGTDVF